MSRWTQNNFPQKIALNGADCFHLVITHLSEKYKAGNNVMHLLLHFKHPINENAIKHRLEESPFLHWVNNIELKTGFWGQIPYWKYQNKNLSQHIEILELNSQNEIEKILLAIHILPNSKEKIIFKILKFPDGKSSLLIAWNHILMDVRGVLNLLTHIENEDQTQEIKDFFPQSSKSILWRDKLKSMMKIKSFIDDSSRGPILSVADRAKPKEKNNFSIYTLEFTESESIEIEKNAIENGSRFGANMFHLACCCLAVNRMLKNRGRQGAFWFPLTYDGRLKGKSTSIISNHVSYLFYRLEATEQENIRDIIKSLNHQMMSQMKAEIPSHYGNLLGLMRHFPLWLYGSMVNKTGEGSMSSFLFSSTGHYMNQFSNFLGNEIENMDIFPTATFPPGLTFSVLLHRNKLKINFVYSKGCLEENEIENLTNDLRRLLLQKTSEN